ncbi:MAG: ATP-binding cassette domain-containing protein [Methanobacteriota archaeon]|nr:MAG: ATP-binding cassette domain-containing protein [Euryarchaeota archaeon]
MTVVPSTHGERLAAFENVNFSYEDGTEALRGITLDIRKGEQIALVGGNGSGKTTLAKHLNGLLKPTTGRVIVKGSDTRKEQVANLARIVGYVFQNPDHQLFCSTVAEEVRFGPMNFGLAEPEVERRTERALEIMTLERLKAEAPLSLSLGDRRRISIASVIAMAPEVIILDEPFTGLDAGEAESLMDVMREMNRQGTTIILITHDMRVVAEHSDRVIVLSHGRKVFDSKTRTAFSDLKLLRECGLIPPPAIQVAHHLREYGVSPEITTVEELADELARVLREQQ